MEEFLSKERLAAAIELLTFKAKIMAACRKDLRLNDVNEILLVAGVGIINPESLKEKDLEVIK